MASSIAVVTGVSKGLGAALAVALHARGFEVVGIGRAVAPAIAQQLRLVNADLADAASLPSRFDALFAELAARAPARIVVVNNAATATPAATIGKLPRDELHASLAVNLEAPMLVADAFVRAFARRSGDRRLVNVSSGAAVHAIAGAAAYCVAKAGLEMLSSAVAAEQATSGIASITIRPGIIDTPMQAFMRSRDSDALPSVDMFKDFHASGQLLSPATVAAKIVDRLVLAPVENGRLYSYAEL